MPKDEFEEGELVLVSSKNKKKKLEEHFVVLSVSEERGASTGIDLKLYKIKALYTRHDFLIDVRYIMVFSPAKTVKVGSDRLKKIFKEDIIGYTSAMLR